MELKVFEKNGETYTRFKVGVKEIYKLLPKFIMALGIPCKKSTRFYYWEKSGDYLNR